MTQVIPTTTTTIQQETASTVEAPHAEAQAPKKQGGKKRVKKEAAVIQTGGEHATTDVPKKSKRAKNAKSAAAEEPAKESAEEEDGKKTDGQRKRTFTVVRVVKEGAETDFKGGRYSSGSPSSAARKSANLACKTYGEGTQEIDIYMQETTKNSAKKLYAYKAVRSPVEEKDVSFKTEKGEAIKVPFKFQMSLKSIREKPEPVAA